MFSLRNDIMKNKNRRFAFIFLFFYYIFGLYELTNQEHRKIITKKLNQQKIEDYTFEGALHKAWDECSYLLMMNNTINRNKTIQMIKQKIINKKTKEFYEEKEKEKQRGKEYYENVRKQSRRKILESAPPQWRPDLTPRPHAPPPYSYFKKSNFKRSTSWNGRRHKSSNSFTGISFNDHNNCSSRCIFARMEMVNQVGFPDESLIIKLIDNKITNKNLRMSKIQRVSLCFRKMEEVVFNDSCIYAAKLFDCMDLAESFLSQSSK